MKRLNIPMSKRVMWLLMLFSIAGACAAVAFQQKRTLSPHGAISISCSNCHTTQGWKPIRPFPDFNHASTRYPLQGKHTGVDCRQCHINLVFSSVGSRCAECHADIHRRQMGNNCEQCHSVRGWQELTKQANGHTNRFPLLGAHASTQCESCHKSAAVGQYLGLSTDCASCHIQDYNNTKSPNHVQGNFPRNCSSCHAMSSWQGEAFDHSSTGFPLTGAHAAQACTVCHANGQFAGLSNACVSCHLADFNGAKTPDHVASNFPQDCSICHSTVNWTGSSFDHSKTQFPLTGAHGSVQCADCHKNGQYIGLPTACVSCHLAKYTSVTDPNHVTAGFSQNCTTCHNTTAWTPAVFDHSKASFPLTGAHQNLQCAACHSSGQYSTLPSTCQSCHLQTFNSTTNPNHVTSGFPQDCSVCHSTTAWTPAVFDHSKTKFPLTGAHTTLQCPACHSSGQYSTLPTTCQSCHLQDFNGTTNPNHSTSGFPQDCSICHSTAAWSPSIFDHSKTNFPLTGAHTSVQCTNCHVSGVYAGTPTDCYSCHSSEYNSTTDPNHAAALFPKTCSQCHTTSSWSGAVFNHTWFPIYSGSHAGKWTTCADCHTNANDYSVFSCITCHAHDKTTMDSKHSGISNYVYNSANCYSCHPTGRSG